MSRLFGVRFEESTPGPAPESVAVAFTDAPGVYIHVPFCRTICPFCPYNKVSYRHDRAVAYFDVLRAETDLVRQVLGGPFPSLYVGGGTPTLCLDELEPLVDLLPVTGERAIEVLPNHMTRTGADRLTDIGFDFVSLGVQSFDPHVLRRLRRPGSPGGNRAAIETALGRFACVDVDLMFDAGFDDPGTLLEDLRICFAYGVEQVSTYPLMRFGYTPFGKVRHQRRREHELLEEATGLAESFGYQRRSVWTFNRIGAPTYSSITRPYYLGLGAGAATFSGSRFWVNHFALDKYSDAIAAGALPVARTARLSPSARAAYRSFWQAYTGEIRIDDADPALRHPVARALRTASRALRWSRREGDTVRLTPTGYDRYHDLERWVTYHLIEPLWQEMMAEHEAPAPSGAEVGP